MGDNHNGITGKRDRDRQDDPGGAMGQVGDIDNYLA